MKYVVEQSNDSVRRYATNVRGDQSGNRIVWDSSPQQDVLVVQMPFGCNAVDSIESICAAMDGMLLPVDCYSEVPSMPGVWIRYVSSASYTRAAGCPLRTKASTYTIFCCRVDGDICYVSHQIMTAGNVPYSNIKLDIEVCLTKLTRTVGPPWRRRVEETGYYQITLPQDRANEVDDGDVYYTVAAAPDIYMPLTREMFRKGCVYIQTHDKPLFASRNDGLRIAVSQ